MNDTVLSSLLQRLNLRFPGLFLLFAVLTLVDIIVPDFIPFIDEIGFGLLTLLLGMWKNRGAASTADPDPNSSAGASSRQRYDL